MNKIKDKVAENWSDMVSCPECGWQGEICELIEGECPECYALIKGEY